MFLFQNVQSLAYTLWTFSRQYRVLYTYLHLTPNKKTGHHHSSFPQERPPALTPRPRFSTTSIPF